VTVITNLHETRIIRVLTENVRDDGTDTQRQISELSVYYYYYYYYYYFSCHRPSLPGNSLEPTVIPTAQASSFTLQYFPYYV